MSEAAKEAEQRIIKCFDDVVGRLSREDYEEVASVVLTHMQMVNEAIADENEND